MITPGAPVLELSEISKSFPGVKALDQVSLALLPGEVHALLGENGAGKSTLIKVIAGVNTPDEGTMRLHGAEVHFTSARQALQAGIAVVHQERNLVPTFTVAENILIERIAGRATAIVDMKRINEAAQPFIEMVGLDISPRAMVTDLSAGKRQMIEIAKALSANASILLLDEPTASISLKETGILFDTVQRLQAQGVAFIFVSHKLEEIFRIAGRVTVLRDGKNAGAPGQLLSTLTTDDLIALMVGRSAKVAAFPRRDASSARVVLEARDLKGKWSPHGNSFALHRGEILGWYGLVGAGRTELAKVVIGADPATSGEILVEDKPARITSVRQALQRWRIGYISENRQEEGLFLMHSLARNISATVWEHMRTRLGLLDTRRELALAEEYRTQLAIRAPSVLQLVANLSGGNRQKVSIAKGLAVKPEILLFDEPTVGIDVKTKSEIHDLIWKLAQEGIAIIVISSDMPEIVKIADRIQVFRHGGICGELLNTKDYDAMSKQIMELIVGDSQLIALEPVST
jgi:ribose transport system ATP-binding protein